MKDAIRIPEKFYRDHVDRGLPAPPILRRKSRGLVIDRNHPDTAELRDDAEYYAHRHGPTVMKQAARKLLDALRPRQS